MWSGIRPGRAATPESGQRGRWIVVLSSDGVYAFVDRMLDVVWTDVGFTPSWLRRSLPWLTHTSIEGD